MRQITITIPYKTGEFDTIWSWLESNVGPAYTKAWEIDMTWACDIPMSQTYKIEMPTEHMFHFALTFADYISE